MSRNSVAEQAADTALAKQAILMQEQHEVALKTANKLGEEDISRLNTRLMLTDKLLAAADADLDAFSYSVAHDLRSPIRQIAGFSKLLAEEFGSQLPAEANRYVDKVIQGAQQMGILIDSLLHLAQLGRQPLYLQRTPMNSLLQAALTSLQAETAGRAIQWQIDALDSIKCDRALITQVFANLLANAIKYTRDASPAVIHVGQMTSKEDQVFFVRDNGVGFDMKYADKLFAVFHRLHSSSEFDGAGVGLATAERILRRHGGHIWAEAAPNQGATFYFTVNADSVHRAAGLESEYD